MERVPPAAPPLPTASAAIQIYCSMSIFPLPDLRSAHHLVRSELLAQLQTDPERGLSGATARRRLEAWGNNQLQEVTGPAWYTLLARQFWSPLVAVLAVGAGLSYYYGDYVNTYAILVVLLLNALIGFYMDWQARKVIRHLRATTQLRVAVLRDGQLVELPAEELVPGDVIRLEAGQGVPADARLLTTTNLGVDESSLTGESGTVSKRTLDPLPATTPLADRNNMLYTGTIVNRGHATAVVTATAAATEMGRSVDLMHSVAETHTPLERKLTRLTHRLIGLTVLLAAVVVGLGIYRGLDTYLVAETAIALAVAAIPEGLPVVFTITLAVGMSRLAQQRILVKELRAVETLGGTEVLMVDKTGTLTQNRITVDTVVQLGDDDKGGGRQELLRAIVLCNTASLGGEAGSGAVVGDPLEVALLRYAEQKGVNVEALRQSARLVNELPFSSESRSMTTVHEVPGENGRPPRYLTVVKGAPERVIDHCTMAVSTDGQQAALDTAWWYDQAAQAAGRGLKTLAVAVAWGDTPTPSTATALLGLTLLSDPPREDVRTAIDQCQAAGIRVVMATGDHAATARSIALATGLVDDPRAEVVEGGALTPERAVGSSILARVTPVEKLTVLQAYQDRGYTVGMVGDGVNDAPALRRADIGVAIGEGGTEAAREAADLILLDNSLPRMVEAIRQGRGIFANIRQFTVYLLSCNLSELLVVGGTFLLAMPAGLLPIQILFLNLLTDVFPALALGFTRAGKYVLRQPPRPRDEPILTASAWRSIILSALLMSASVIAVVPAAEHYDLLLPGQHDDLLFYTLLAAQLWYVLALPAPGERWWGHPVLRNAYLWGALAFCVVLVVAAYALPLTRTTLQLEAGVEPSLIMLAVLFGGLPVLPIRLLRPPGAAPQKPA